MRPKAVKLVKVSIAITHLSISNVLKYVDRKTAAKLLGHK